MAGDASMPMPDDEENEPIQIGDKLPVKLDTMMVGGERPEVGDQVEVTVGGIVSHIIDDYALVALETANQEPIQDTSLDQQEQALDQMSQKMDITAGSPIGYGT